MKLFIRLNFVLITVLLFCASVIAQTLPTDPNVGKILTELFTNWKGLGGLGVAMSLIVLFVQVLKWTVLDKVFEGKVKSIIKLGLVLVLGQVYSVLFLVKSGMPALQAVIGVVTGGGAIALYNVLKPLWDKK